MSAAGIIEEEAAGLLARLDKEPANATLQAQIDQWVAADPRHEVAYLRLKAAWRELDRAAAVGSRENANWWLRAEVVPPRRRTYQIAAAAAAVTAVCVALWWRHTAPPRAPIAFSTPVGGYTRQTLEDGSTVELNTQTAIEVAFDAPARRVRLLRGEARFHVSKDAHRPFLVEAGSRRVRAVGTDFTVHMKPAETEVLVAEGRVAVELLSHQQAATFVDPGQLASVTSQGVLVTTLPPAQVAARLSWDRGVLVFSHEKLSIVAAELNRYNTLQIHVADPTAAAMQLGGTFTATNAEAFIGLLAEILPVTVARTEDGVTVAARPPSHAAQPRQ